ncbi:phosphotransferase [Oceanomicrobium pacificus]|nr:phosphotransferase [Oceanomicrobium pacificus]
MPSGAPVAPDLLPASVRDHLEHAGLSPGAAERLDGGRTNRAYKVAVRDGPLVVKLFSADAGTDVFPNSPDDEWRSLAALAGSGLAPDPVLDGRASPAPFIAYAHLPGGGFCGDLAEVAPLLARLHAAPRPDWLRAIGPLDAHYAAQADRLEAALPQATVTRLRKARPDAPAGAVLPPVFCHGDVTLENLVGRPGQWRLIDWQCPAAAEAADDLLTLLSPAMHVLHGSQPPDGDTRDRVLAAYPDRNVAARVQALAPLAGYRMALYCLWRAEQGARAYRAGAEAEWAALTGDELQ